MLEIGTEFDWNGDNLYGRITVMGYVYYQDALYYTCINEDGVEGDVHHSDAEEAIDGD